MDPRDVKLLEKRVVLDYEKLRGIVEAYRELGWRIVVTIGTYDLIHVGHSRYLAKAAELGDILIVGVDSDRAVKLYKKDDRRPIVPEAERLEMLLHLQHVSFVTLIDDVDPQGRWSYGLLDVIHPDVFLAVTDSYPEDQVAEIKERCGELVIVGRQAETSTSEKIRQLAISQAKPLAERLRDLADQIEGGEQ